MNVRWVAVVLACGLAGCGGDDGLPPKEALAEQVVLTLTSDASTYAVGDNVVVTLTNGSDGRVEFNHWCSTHLDRYAEGTWARAWSPTSCPLPLEILASERSASWDFGVATETPGVFRITFRYSDALTVHTPEFTVR